MILAFYSTSKTMAAKLEHPAEKVVNPKNSRREIMDIYNDWATKYDRDKDQRGFCGQTVAAQAFQHVVTDRRARVLDIGAGTGSLGVCLKEAGYTNIDALDPNEAMLGVARKLKVYRNFIVDFLAKNKLDVENDTYDAIMGTGVFVPGHINEDCFDELCRITKPGGYVVLICSDRYKEDKYDGYGHRFASAIQEHESRGLWKIEKQESLQYDGSYNGTFSYLVIQ